MPEEKRKRKLEKEIKRIVAILAAKYKPQKVILFGSAAGGSFQEGSDIDFLIIKSSSLDRIKRAVAVEKLLSDRTLPLDILVYTPAEIEESLKVRGSFTENILKTGKVLYEA